MSNGHGSPESFSLLLIENRKDGRGWLYPGAGAGIQAALPAAGRAAK